MARRSDHSKEELRNMAIAAAEQLVIAKGIGGISARKVAGEMGYTAGTLYLLFRNLDDLITEVNLRTLQQLETEIEQAVEGERDSVAAIYAIARGYLRYAQMHTNRWLAVFEHRLGGETFPAHYHMQVDRLFALVEAPLRSIRGSAVPQSEIAKEARALWAGVHGLAALTERDKLNAAGIDPDDIVKLLIGRILGVEKIMGGEV